MPATGPDLPRRARAPTGSRLAGSWRRLARWLVLAGLASAIGLALAQAPGTPPQVLALLSYDPQLPWTRAVVAGMLDEAAGQHVSLDLQLLDQQRAGTPELNADRARLIIDRYRDRRPDVIITESLPAALFHARHLEAALPGVPVVVLVEGADGARSGQPATEVMVETRLAETVDLALALHRPETAYLIGDRQPESQSNLDALQALLAKHQGVSVERLDTLGLAQIAERLAGLPESGRAVAFYGLVFSDEKGQSLPPAAALELIGKSSRVPIYSFWDTMIGRGAVGGYVTVPLQIGRQLLHEALRSAQAAGLPAAASAGASAVAEPRQLKADAALAFDARQLKRWGLSADELPAGAEVRFREPSLWSDHQREILGAVALLALQAGLIAALLANRRGRLSTMKALAQERSSLELRVAERTHQLAETELRLRTVADHNSNWETWNGADGRWLYCSPSCQRTTGRAATDFMADAGLFTRIVHADDRERVARHMAATCSPDGPFDEFDFRIRHADGHDVWMSHVCQPVFDAGGQFLGHRASNSDITRRKTAEIGLIASEARLRQANEVAETAARAKAQFLANMSHELRTPLNGIMGLTAVAKSKCADPAVARLLGMVESSSNRLAELITGLLDVTALQSDRLELDLRRFRLGDMLRSVFEQAAAAAAEKRLTFSTDVDAGLLDTQVIGDEHRLAQVLGNLTGNAVKFTEHGGVAVRLSVRDDGPDAVCLRCDVVDSGPGIAEATQRGLFVAFAQVDSSSTRRHQGAGLGLAISKRLVEAMGGQIGLRSQLGQGSTFWFSVRLVRALA